jgi:hypothetical protein
MSETFSQPTSPTAGLQNYNLERGPKALYPGPDVGLSVRRRRAARRLLILRRGLKKESTAMTIGTIEAMAGTLSKSVASIIQSNPTNRDELIEQSIAEYTMAVVGEAENEFAEELGKAAPQEDDLFKGLGCVGRVANMLSLMANSVQEIQMGCSSYAVRDGQLPPDADPASPEVCEMLDHLVAHAEAVLSAVVNEHCMPMEEGEEAPEGMHVMMVPLHDGMGKSLPVATDLPEELAKFACDPAALQEAAVERGLEMIEMAGVDVAPMVKMLQGGELQKDASGMPPDPSAMQPGMSPGDDPSMPDDGTDGGDPIETLGRLLALCMVVVDQISQAVDGQGGASDPTGEEGDPSEDDPSGGVDPNAGAAAAAPGVSKSLTIEDLSKLEGPQAEEALGKLMKANGLDMDTLRKAVTDAADLRAQVAEYEVLSKRLLARAEPPKGPLVTSGALAKSGEDSLAPAAVEQDLSKLSHEDRLLVLTKRQHAVSGKPA